MTARVLVKGDRVEVHLGHNMQYATIASVIDEVGARYTVEYSDDEDFYTDDDFEDDEDNEEDPDGGGVKKHAPKAAKYVQMDEFEDEKRRDEGRRDAEEVASAMRLVGTGERKILETNEKNNPKHQQQNHRRQSSGEKVKDVALKNKPPSMSTDVRNSIQRIRFNCKEEAMDGLGRDAYEQIEQLCRDVMKGKIVLDEVKKNKQDKGPRRSNMELEWIRILGGASQFNEEKLRWCKKVEEVVTVEMCFF